MREKKARIRRRVETKTRIAGAAPEWFSIDGASRLTVSFRLHWSVAYHVPERKREAVIASRRIDILKQVSGKQCDQNDDRDRDTDKPKQDGHCLVLSDT